MPRIQEVGGYFHLKLNELAAKHSFVNEVRGFGLMLGVELADPRQTDRPGRHAAGLLINCTHDTVLRFLPPYTITEKEVDQAVKVLAKVFARQKQT